MWMGKLFGRKLSLVVIQHIIFGLFRQSYYYYRTSRLSCLQFHHTARWPSVPNALNIIGLPAASLLYNTPRMKYALLWITRITTHILSMRRKFCNIIRNAGFSYYSELLYPRLYPNARRNVWDDGNKLPFSLSTRWWSRPDLVDVIFTLLISPFNKYWSESVIRMCIMQSISCRMNLPLTCHENRAYPSPSKSRI